jgi:hypothetical protein
MKVVSFLIAVCCFSSLLAAQTTTSFHATAESAVASANVNGTGLSVDVGRGDFLGTPVTFMFMFSFTQNADGSFTEIFGSGTIPDQSFTNAGMEQMDLNVDTSTTPNFHATQCTFRFTPFFSSTCTAAPTGVIQVHWNNNKITTKRLLIESRRTFPNAVSIRSHQDLDQSSADASGSFLGLSFPNAFQAEVQMNRDTQITITQ